MRTVLEHSNFSLHMRFLVLDQNFCFEIACQPSPIDNTNHNLTSTNNRLLEQFHNGWINVGSNGSSVIDSKTFKSKLQFASQAQ
jgi:hypothetical protein